MRIKTINARRSPGYFPYYKLQWYDSTIMAWREVQKRFTTPESAEAAAPGLIPQGTEHRLMEIHRDSRHPYSPL